jgi:hypothetical protein
MPLRRLAVAAHLVLIALVAGGAAHLVTSTLPLVAPASSGAIVDVQIDR